MNDFTKEELQIIFLHLCVTPVTTPIIDKITSMIDDYCEHENDVWPLYTAKGDTPCARFCYDCNKALDKSFDDE